MMHSQLISSPPSHAPSGLLLPESFLHSPTFGLLSAFVAVNTVVYVALAIVKMLPALPIGMLFHRRNRRSENRSIYTDVATRKAVEAGATYGRMPAAPPTG